MRGKNFVDTNLEESKILDLSKSLDFQQFSFIFPGFWTGVKFTKSS